MDFHSGLTLVIGANGLGKTTIITILYRMFTGPYDVPALAYRALGTAELQETSIPRDRRLIFAKRTADGARDASATLTFRIAQTDVTVERSLRDLSLLSAVIGGNPIEPTEDNLKNELKRLVGVWSFGDFMLVLQQLVFYFETRQELVWDASAQRELLRALFLSVDDARTWAEDERAILRLDSHIRNLSAVRNRLERDVAVQARQVATLPEVRTELDTLNGLQEVDMARRERLNAEIDAADAQRRAARLRQMNGAQAREERYRELERAKLISITAEFPTQSETTRYIIGQLVGDGHCLVCGSDATRAARLLASRVSRNQCALCATPLKILSRASVSDKQMEGLRNRLDQADREASAADAELRDANNHYQEISRTIDELNVAITDRSRTIDALVAKLPPKEAILHGKLSELAGWKAREDASRTEVANLRAAFKNFVDDKNLEIQKFADRVKRSFHSYAKGFLVEDCSLVWQPRRDTLGQMGEKFDFPAFELNMGGAGFIEPVRRSGPDQVSESQREFIDLAFRMALIDVATGTQSGSLVIDAPESSLDMVFAKRAGGVLAEFAGARDNRLVVTSNLVASDLVSELVYSIPRKERSARVVDLFEIAEKTAAVRDFWDEYKRARKKLLT